MFNILNCDLFFFVSGWFLIPFLSQYWISFITSSVDSFKRSTLSQFLLVIPHRSRCWSSWTSLHLHSAVSPIFYHMRFSFILPTFTLKVLQSPYFRFLPGGRLSGALVHIGSFVLHLSFHLSISSSVFDCWVSVMLCRKLCLDFNRGI